ncbi:MAG: peroxiredoxin [Deltaproteobacteria bacterium]|nr:peroxiredoxin [Deltaproteobacteria bacterium]
MKVLRFLISLASCALLVISCGNSSTKSQSLQIGDTAPEFSTMNETGEITQLEDYKGKYILLFFYPKDDTPGCTEEALNFAKFYKQFKELNTEIIGINYDNSDSHLAFKSKFNLPFPLLSDTDKKISKTYGSEGMIFSARDSFLIGPQGKILQIYRSVDPNDHAQNVLEDLKTINGSPHKK